jgi:hypothetical protein
MSVYTFRLLSEYGGRFMFECSKWSSEKEPVDTYTLIVKPRSVSCSCYARGPCKHMDLAREIVDNDMQREMHRYIWDYQNTWQYSNDMEYA